MMTEKEKYDKIVRKQTISIDLQIKFDELQIAYTKLIDRNLIVERFQHDLEVKEAYLIGIKNIEKEINLLEIQIQKLMDAYNSEL